MADACPIPTPEQRRYGEFQDDALRIMWDKILAAVTEAHASVRAQLEASGLEEPPPFDYFLATAHQRLFCALCKADPSTFKGGDAKAALFVIRNCQNMAKRYWGAEIAPPSEPAGSPWTGCGSASARPRDRAENS